MAWIKGIKYERGGGGDASAVRQYNPLSSAQGYITALQLQHPPVHMVFPKYSCPSFYLREYGMTRDGQTMRRAA